MASAKRFLHVDDTGCSDSCSSASFRCPGPGLAHETIRTQKSELGLRMQSDFGSCVLFSAVVWVPQSWADQVPLPAFSAARTSPR